MAKVDPVKEFLAGRKPKRLTPAEEKEYHEKAMQGDESALETLIISQAHWVWTICYAHPKPPQISNNDLFDDAICHVYLSLKNFDPSKGRLSSYLRSVIPRKCSDYIVKMSSTFGKKLPVAYASSASNSCFLFDEDGVKQRIAEPPESNIYEDAYHDEVDELAEVVASILSNMSKRSRWIIARRCEGLTAEEIAKEETEANLREGKRGRPTDSAQIMQALHAIRRHIFQELIRRDIPLDCCVPGSRIGRLFEEASASDQNRLFE